MAWRAVRWARLTAQRSAARESERLAYELQFGGPRRAQSHPLPRTALAHSGGAWRAHVCAARAGGSTRAVVAGNAGYPAFLTQSSDDAVAANARSSSTPSSTRSDDGAAAATDGAATRVRRQKSHSSGGDESAAVRRQKSTPATSDESAAVRRQKSTPAASEGGAASSQTPLAALGASLTSIAAVIKKWTAPSPLDQCCNAAKCGNVSQLLDALKRIDDMDAVDRHGHTPLLLVSGAA